jgi:hypothetical protein
MAGTSAKTNRSGAAAMSKVAVFKRIQNSGEWLKWMCTHIYRNAGLLVEKPGWLKDRNVLLVDGSEDARGGAERLYFMLHYSMNLFTLEAREFAITDEKTGEKLSNFTKLGPQDIVIGDRAYGTLAGLSHLKAYGADYALRLRGRAFNLYDEKGCKIDLMKEFSGLLSWKCREITGWCDINGKREPVRVCALRKGVMNEQEGMRRLKSGGIYVSALREEHNKYIIVITSLGKDVKTEQVLDLYRMRWQIEIAFKRLKSLFRYNEMPARKTENIKTWFYGKLLLAALCETLVNAGRFSPSGRKGGKRRKARP